MGRIGPIASGSDHREALHLRRKVGEDIAAAGSARGTPTVQTPQRPNRKPPVSFRIP